MSHVELYEALKGSIGPEAARMIADVVPPGRDVATRHDVQALRVDFEGLRADFEGLRADFGELRGEFGELRGEFGELRGEFGELRGDVVGQIGALESRLMGRMWAMFVPLWVGMFGLIATLIVALIVRG